MWNQFRLGFFYFTYIQHACWVLAWIIFSLPGTKPQNSLFFFCLLFSNRTLYLSLVTCSFRHFHTYKEVINYAENFAIFLMVIYHISSLPFPTQQYVKKLSTFQSRRSLSLKYIRTPLSQILPKPTNQIAVTTNHVFIWHKWPLCCCDIIFYVKAKPDWTVSHVKTRAWRWLWAFVPQAFHRDFWPSLVQEFQRREVSAGGKGKSLPLLLLLQLAPPPSLPCLPGYWANSKPPWTESCPAGLIRGRLPSVACGGASGSFSGEQTSSQVLWLLGFLYTVLGWVRVCNRYFSLVWSESFGQTLFTCGKALCYSYVTDDHVSLGEGGLWEAEAARGGCGPGGMAKNLLSYAGGNHHPPGHQTFAWPGTRPSVHSPPPQGPLFSFGQFLCSRFSWIAAVSFFVFLFILLRNILGLCGLPEICGRAFCLLTQYSPPSPSSRPIEQTVAASKLTWLCLI